jgi:hypothetical protein
LPTIAHLTPQKYLNLLTNTWSRIELLNLLAVKSQYQEKSAVFPDSERILGDSVILRRQFYQRANLQMDISGLDKNQVARKDSTGYSTSPHQRDKNRA